MFLGSVLYHGKLPWRGKILYAKGHLGFSPTIPVTGTTSKRFPTHDVSLEEVTQLVGWVYTIDRNLAAHMREQTLFPQNPGQEFGNVVRDIMRILIIFRGVLLHTVI